MKKKESFLKGIMALMISQIFIKIIGLAYKLYLTNKEGFGDCGNAIYSSGFQIYALLLAFSSTGVPSAISKMVSERLAIGDNRGAHLIFKIAFMTFSIIGLAGTIFLFTQAQYISSYWLQIPEAKYCLIALSPSIFFVSVLSVLRGYFNGRQSLSTTAKSQSVEQVLKTFFTIALVEVVSKYFIDNVVIMAAVANLATSIATVFSFVYLYKYYILRRKEFAQEISYTVNSKPTRVRKTIKEIIKVSFPISLSAFMSSFNKNIDSFTIVRILKKYMSIEEAKVQYGILSGKIDTLCTLPLALNIPFVSALVPSLSKSYIKKNKEEVEKKIIIYLLISAVIALPATCGMIIFAEPILSTLFPNASSGVIILKINSISIIFMIFAQTINAILQAIGKEQIPLISFAIGIIIKIICNISLIRIPWISSNGAAVGNILCNFYVCLIGIIYIKKETKIKFEKRRMFLKPLISTIIMCIISWRTYLKLSVILFNKLATILSILVAIIVYVFSILILKTIKKEDIKYLKI